MAGTYRIATSLLNFTKLELSKVIPSNGRERTKFIVSRMAAAAATIVQTANAANLMEDLLLQRAAAHILLHHVHLLHVARVLLNAADANVLDDVPAPQQRYIAHGHLLWVTYWRLFCIVYKQRQCLC